MQKGDASERRVPVMASLLDPRYKDIRWVTPAERAAVTEKLAEDFYTFAATLEPAAQPAPAPQASSPRPAKRAKKASRVLFADSDEDAPAAPPAQQPRMPPREAWKLQWRMYNMLAKEPRSSDPLAWWQARQGEFPELAKFARLFLQTPASSAAVERLFSVAGRMFHGRDASAPETAEKLIVCHANWRLVEFS